MLGPAKNPVLSGQHARTVQAVGWSACGVAVQNDVSTQMPT